MKWSMSSVAILIVCALSVVVGAQSGATMAKGDKMDKMEMRDTSYTGCIEAGSAAGTFTMTHLMVDDQMGKDTMKKGAMKSDTMTKDNTAKEGMGNDGMALTTLSLTGSSIDLRKHLGHKVSVTGSLAHEKMDAMEKGTTGRAPSTFTVKSLKMVAATCS